MANKRESKVTREYRERMERAETRAALLSRYVSALDRLEEPTARSHVVLADGGMIRYATYGAAAYDGGYVVSLSYSDAATGPIVDIATVQDAEQRQRDRATVQDASLRAGFLELERVLIDHAEAQRQAFSVSA